MPTISSSSSMFCEYPNCSGVSCANFSSWLLNNVKFSNTNGGKLYALFNNFGSIQQIELYKDPNYYEIIAIGQGTIGLIPIVERNGSGITGSVEWDGTPVIFSSGVTLDCGEIMSSSSTSSLDSSSTSSESISSESSETTGCCENPLCYGNRCNYFGIWNIYGMAQSNSNNCRLYVGMEYANGYQQLRIYKDETLYDLAAIGQKSFAGTIQLISTNDSGIYGNVWWDGHPIAYPEILILDCKQSSSSSHSSESIGNTSSSTSSSTSCSTSSSESSSSSIDSSSSSSTSLSSSSSSTSESNSSSSSIDSSSTSSESIANTSSSSSSSLEIWNQSKPLIFANSAIDGATSRNRLSQAIQIYDLNYEIGKVYCYLYSSNVVHFYNVNLSLCLCNNNGSPTTVITTRSIDATEINSDMWYAFNFDVVGVTPSNKLLSFVLWQDGGNEDDYVMWGYNIDSKQTYAWFSNDNIVWSQQLGVTRSLKVVGTFDSIDLDNYQVNTSGATTRTISQSMNVNSSYYNTVYLSNPSRVELDNPNLIVSFVVDASGSMGWNDRNNNRKDFITSTIQRFNDYYPSNVLFDIIKFGSKTADTTSVTSGMGQVVAVTFDIRTPSRTVYVFTTEDIVTDIEEGAIYNHNDFTYLAFKNYSDSYEIAMTGDGVPLSEGTLQKTYGNGPNLIVFRASNAISIDTSFIVASGLKNMEDGHTYNFAGADIDNNSLFTISNVASDVNKWQAISPSSESPQIISSLSNGPRDSSSIDIVATENLVARTPIGLSAFYQTSISTSVSEGATAVTVSNASSFATGSLVDFVDTKYASIGHTITAIESNIITFSPPLKYNIGSYIDGGFIQESSLLNKKNIEGTTGKVYLRDVNATHQVTFYLQTSEGYLIEWDIQATSEWFIYNLYWIGESANLPLSVFDTEGNAFPNGTRLDLEVNSMIDTPLQTYQLLSLTASKDQPIIYLQSIEGFETGQNVTLIDNKGNVQILTIYELGIDETDGPYIIFTTNLNFEFSPLNGARLVASINPQLSSDNSPVSIDLPIVDVTPICTDTDLDERESYEWPAVPKDTSYESLNNAAAYIRYGTINIPTINGIAVVRILPITEDVLKSDYEKSNDFTRQLIIGPPEKFVGQGSQNEGDLNDIGDVTQTTTTISTVNDYIIESPVFLYKGTAQSAMSTTSTSIQQLEFPELTVPGLPISENQTLEGVQYKIFPALVDVSSANTVVAKQYLDSFIVNFVAPYSIFSVKETKAVSYYLPEFEPSPPEGCGYFKGYKGYSLTGVFATTETENSDKSFTINYVVTNKLILVRSAQMRIRIYSNPTVNQELLASNGIVETQYNLNVKYNPINVLQSDGTYKQITKLSPIDTWRAYVSGDQKTLTDAGYTLSSQYGDANVWSSLVGEALGTLMVTKPDGNENEPINLFYSKGFEQATQYEIYDTYINIENGRATFTLPPNTKPSTIIVEASIAFSQNYEAIRSDVFVVRNPIVVGEPSPAIIQIVDGKKYELNFPIVWEDGTEPIDVGTTVNITPSTTNISPTESKTDENGQANGIFIGERDLFFYGPEECPKKQNLEIIEVIVTHPQSGYSTTISRTICWEGSPSETEVTSNYFHVTGEDILGYADGAANTVSTFRSDLFDSQNVLWVTDDGIQRLMGNEQSGKSRRDVLAGYTGEISIVPSRMPWGPDGKVEFVAKGLNKNIGLPDQFGSIQFSTEYSKGNEIVSLFGIQDFDESEQPVSPTVIIREPLGIELSLEKHKDIGFIRNGIDSANIVATVTWKGEKITNSFTDPNTNASILYPMPMVTFKAGKCFLKNGEGDILDSRGKIPLDPKNHPLDISCLFISDHPDISISSPIVQTALIRTDIFNLSHTHSCVIGDDGSGETTGTIVLDGIVSEHHHNIVNYVSVDQTQSILDPIVVSHTHGIRSVAITQINPMTNTGVEITINGYVVYDPTNCIPNDNGSTPSYFPVGLPSGNRIMFDTEYVLGYTPTNKNLKLNVYTGSDLTNSVGTEIPIDVSHSIASYFAAATPDETQKGFDIRIQPIFPSYIYESSPGVANVVSETTVDDGTRVSVEIVPYKAKIPEGKQNQPHIVGPDIINEYMVLKFIVSANASGQFATRSFYVPINSNLQWLPGITNLLPEISNDSSYITTAIDRMDGFMGASQIHDAVIESAQKIIQEQTDHPEYKQYEKIIFIVSDGDENKSFNSITKTINNISFIDGKENTPSIGIVLGHADPSDSITLKKYAMGTNGSFYSLNDMSSSTINDIIDFIFVNNGSFNYGTFRSLVSFEQAIVPISFNLGETYIPSGTSMNYRTRYTSDGIQWSPWSLWRSSTSSSITYSNFTNKILQYQYEVQFYGDKDFNSPVLYGVGSLENSSSSSESNDVSSSSSSESFETMEETDQTAPSIEYYSPKSLVLFFKPISLNTNADEYLSSVLITHEADIPSTSKIEYGIVQSNDTDVEYYEVDGKAISPDKHEIILTRYNEPLITENYKNYVTLNGKWNENCSIEIYRFNDSNPDGILVNSSEYVINSKKGEISFFNSQITSDSFTINVLFRPFFRLIAKITNNGVDSAVIHHIGVIYNITKRIPRSIDGNIIHKPINQRL